MTDLPIVLALFVLSFISVLTNIVILLILEHHLNTQKISDESGDNINLEQTKQKSYEIISKSIKTANKILTNAELKGVGIIAKEKIAGNKLARSFESHMAELEKSLQAHFDESIGKVEKEYISFLTALEKNAATHASETTKAYQLQATEFINKIQRELDSVTSDVRKRIDAEMTSEFTAVRESLEEYKERRMKIINENIVEILEKTLKIALGKTMSLTDQSDLIYKALEAAKEENALS